MPNIIFPSEELLRSRIIRIELTPENWRDNPGGHYYPWFHTRTNHFGGITDSTESRPVGFGIQEGYAGRFKDVGMKSTGGRQYKMEDERTRSAEPFSFDRCNRSPLENVHPEACEWTAAVGFLSLPEVGPEITLWLSAPKAAGISIFVGDQWYGEVDCPDVLYDTFILRNNKKPVLPY